MTRLFNSKFLEIDAIKKPLEYTNQIRLRVCSRGPEQGFAFSEISQQNDVALYLEARMLLEDSLGVLISKELLQSLNRIIVKRDVRITDSNFQIFPGRVEVYGRPIYHSADRSEDEIDNLICWLYSDSTLALSVILQASIAHYKFVKIHPFLGGNGRTARLLTRHILRRGGYDEHCCNQFEAYIEQNKIIYYQALDFRRNGEKIEFYDEENGNDITLWVEFFCNLFMESLVLLKDMKI